MSVPKNSTAPQDHKTKKAKNSKSVSSAQSWKHSNTLELEVPSGHTALVRNPGMRAFLTAGIIPNSLLPIVTEALERGEPPSTDVLKGLMDGPDKFQIMNELFDATDAVTVHCVLEPKVHSDKFSDLGLLPKSVQGAARSLIDQDLLHEGDELPKELRDEELLYVDEVDFMDKTFIFNWAVGGTRDLERFREEYGSSLAAIQHGNDVES